MWNVSSDPSRFAEAVAWHRRRTPFTDEQWKALDRKARQKAFTVARVAQLDLVTEVWHAIERAIDEGTTLRDFKATLGPKLRAAWQGSVERPAHRLETIFRTNVQKAYAAGRYAQAQEVKDDRPFWMFDAVLDSRTSEICEACNGTVRPADDPWWSTHQPPLHFNCRSTVITLSPEEAHAQGISALAPRAEALEGFGAAPDQDDWEPKVADYPSELWATYEKR